MHLSTIEPNDDDTDECTALVNDGYEESHTFYVNVTGSFDSYEVTAE